MVMKNSISSPTQKHFVKNFVTFFQNPSNFKHSIFMSLFFRRLNFFEKPKNDAIAKMYVIFFLFSICYSRYIFFLPRENFDNDGLETCVFFSKSRGVIEVCVGFKPVSAIHFFFQSPLIFAPTHLFF